MAYIYDLTDTWNAGGTTFNAIKMNVTDSASAAGSKLVTLQTNGTEHFSVTKAGVGYFSGNVGIGTSSPSAKLQVDGPFIRYGNSASYTSDEFIIQRVAAGVNLSVRQNVAMMLLTNDTERMRITSAGNVGIGTTSPEARLDVWGSSGDQIRLRTAATEFYRMGRNNATGVMEFYGSQTGFTSYTFGGVDGERMRIDNSGNVGIGTSSPSTKLHVAGGSVTEVRVTSSGNLTTGAASLLRFGGSNSATSGYIGYGGTTSTIDLWNTLAGSLTFGTSNLERMRIDASGNVGIGTSSPSAPFHVKLTTDRNMRVLNAYSSVAMGSTTDAGAEAPLTFFANPITFVTNNTERARIDSSGNLLVGTTSAIASGRISVQSTGSAPALVGRSASDSIQLYTTQTSGTSYFGYWVYNGTNVGSITSTGTTTAYNTSSDARLKHDIVDAPEASSLIDAIKVRSFKWNADNSEQRYGMIAQELLEVAPEAVSHDPDDEEKMMGVDYSKLVPMLVKEIQSLRARVAQLEGN